MGGKAMQSTVKLQSEATRLVITWPIESQTPELCCLRNVGTKMTKLSMAVPSIFEGYAHKLGLVILKMRQR